VLVQVLILVILQQALQIKVSADTCEDVASDSGMWGTE